MANKSVYQSFDTDALNYYDLTSAPMYGVVVGSIVENVLCTQDKTTYEKILSSLSVSTEVETTFINKKKAFILPNCDVSQDRLKAALKEHKITVTNDYTKADLIIGHDDISRKFENGGNIMSSMLLGKLWNYEATTGTGSANTTMKALLFNSTEQVLVTEKITLSVRYYDLDIGDSLYDEWMITGLALNLAHLIDTTDVSVVSPEIILHSSANKILMTEELLTDLTKLLGAYGDDNKAIAGKIIPTIDYTKNYHLLWRFAQNNGSEMYNYRRDKDVQYWLKESNFNYFYETTAQNMILWLERTEKLDTASFRYLEPIVREEISIHNRDLYVFNVSVKKEYQQYLKK